MLLNIVSINFTGYVDDIFETLVKAMKANSLQQAIEKLTELTPPPMHTMLDKQPRSDAIAKKKARDSMTYEEVPPTTPGKTANFTCKKNNHMCY